MEYVPSVAFLLPKKTPSNTHLVVFRLSLLMGYINSAPSFCMATKTVANLANEAISQRYQAREHLLEMAGKARSADDSGTPEAQADAN